MYPTYKANNIIKTTKENTYANTHFSFRWKKKHAWCQICIQWQFSGAEMQSSGSWIKQGPNSDKSQIWEDWNENKCVWRETKQGLSRVQWKAPSNLWHWHLLSFSSEVWTPIIITPCLKRDHKLDLFLRRFKLWQVEPYGELLKLFTFLRGKHVQICWRMLCLRNNCKDFKWI